MARERSHVRKRRRGCLSGCLVNILLLFGVAALLFVAACSLGVIRNDPQTGAPYVTFEEFGLGRFDLGEFEPAAFVSSGLSLPEIDWPYRVNRSGLTVKTLRAGDGEAVLVCSDGYTMLLGGGEGFDVNAVRVVVYVEGYQLARKNKRFFADGMKCNGKAALIFEK